MAISNTTASAGPFTPNGSTTVFPYTFAALSASEIKVVRINSAGAQTVLSGWTATYGVNGGSVTFTTAPAAGDPITILSNPSFAQQVDFQNQGAFLPGTLNGALDRGVIRDIYLKDQVSQVALAAALASAAIASEATARAAADATLAAAIAAIPSGGGGGGSVDPTLIAAYTFATAAGVAFATGVVSIDTIGYNAPGDGGGASYIYDAAVDSAYVTANPRTSFMATGSRGFRLDPSQRLTIEMFGGKGDLVTNLAVPPTIVGTPTDNLAAFDAYWNYARYMPANTGQVVPRLHFGAAGYYFSATLQPYSMVHLVGVGSSSASISGTVFCFPANTIGLAINGPQTSISGAITFGSKGNGASGSFIEGIYFLSCGGTDPTKHGFWPRFPFRMEDCVIDSFPGNGTNLVASTSGDATTLGNACESYMRNVEYRNIKGKAAHYVAGSDANDCTFDSLRVKDCYGVGILDTSQFGNTYLRPTVNGSGEVRAAGDTIANLGRVSYGGHDWQLIAATDTGTVPGTNSKIWHDAGADASPNLTYWPAWSSGTTYVSGAAAILGPGNCTMVGGYCESLNINLIGDAQAFGGVWSPFEANNHLLTWQSHTGLYNGQALGVRKTWRETADIAAYGATSYAAFGVRPAAGQYNILQHYDDQDGRTYCLFRTSGGAHPGDLVYANTPQAVGGSAIYRITGRYTDLQFNRAATVPDAFMPTILALKDPNNPGDYTVGRILGFTDTAPSSGTGGVGDRLWRATPTALGVGEWIKTTTGWIAKSAAVGYATGTGGAVTQATSKSTNVTLDKLCGQITMNNAALAANAVVSFVLFNATIDDGDVPVVTINSGSATRGTYRIGISQVDPGNCVIDVHNVSGGSLSEALVLNFAVIKAVAA
jgi:hypothetical protein